MFEEEIGKKGTFFILLGGVRCLVIEPTQAVITSQAKDICHSVYPSPNYV
jgi:hypothetical protein